jgi:PAS domain S-box-containing protein
MSRISPLARAREATKSLRFRATVGVVSFLCLVAVGLSALFLATWEIHERALARNAALRTARSLADAVSAELARGDPERARAALETRLRHEPTLVLATILDGAGEIARLDARCSDAMRARLGPPAASPATRVLARGGPHDLLDVTLPLAPDDSPGGAGETRLRVAFALAPDASQASELRWRVVAITLAMLVLGTAGTMTLVGRILGPLSELAQGTDRVAQGDFDSRIRVETDDEIGVLARSFNQMTERLRWWGERQRSWSRELEQRVESKTREIAETREHLVNIVENVGASILVADLDGTVISANTHTMHIFGTKPEFAVGRRLEEFAGDAAAKPETLLPFLAAGRSRVTETRRGEGAGARDLLVVQTLLRDSAGRAAGFLQIAKDVTELREMERRLVHSERLSAMGEMAGEIGHELNNYLMAIGGRAELIVESLRDEHDAARLPKIRRSAEIIAEQVAEMRRLTDGLLDAARKESSPADVDLGELVAGTIEFVRPQNRFDGIAIELTRAPGPLRLFADPQQVRQVVLNLLTNAAESTRERRDAGGVIRVETFREGGDVGFRVADEGAGIAEAIRERIFEPHFTTKTKGHGFGLAVCHRVVANHGGSIRVDSRPGEGATFTVRLPLRRDPAPGAAAAAAAERAPSSRPPSPGIASPSSRSARP